ncbi:MAG: cytochrome c biogenesis protein CcdA [Chromatiales bacterium]
MSGAELTTAFLLPIGLGLLAFVEPCAIGATLLFIKLVEGKPARVKVGQAVGFMLTRGLFIGLLGAGAAWVGGTFFALQKAGWFVFGTMYVAIGLMYLTGHVRWLMHTVGPRLSRLGDVRSSVTLGLLFGLNIPACAGPLLVALLAATATGATPGGVAGGFISLSLFGLALSVPLVAAVLFGPARRALDWIAGLSARIPRLTGLLMIVLGVGTIWFGLSVKLA